MVNRIETKYVIFPKKILNNPLLLAVTNGQNNNFSDKFKLYLVTIYQIVDVALH